MVASTGVSDGAADYCPACGGEVVLDRLDSAGDSPCPHCDQLLWFVRRAEGNAVILTLLPGLIAGSDSMLRVSEILTAANDSPRIVLNLNRMRMITSMVLAMLVVVYRRTLAAERQLKLCGLNDDTMESFRVTRLDLLFDICDDEKQALVDP